jgi:hypothetical protein
MEFASEKKNPRAKISQKKYRMQLEWKSDKVSRRFQGISISSFLIKIIEILINQNTNEVSYKR